MSIDQKLLDFAVTDFENNIDIFKERLQLIFKEITEELDIDRCFCRFFDNHAMCNFSLVWNNRINESLPDFNNSFNIANLSWLLQRISNDNIHYVSCIDEIPKEAVNEIDSFKKFKIKSLLVKPIYIEGAFGGLFGFTNSSKTIDWNNTHFEIAKKVSAVISYSIKTIYKAQLDNQYNLDKFNLRPMSFCFVFDMDSYKFSFLTRDAFHFFNMPSEHILYTKKVTDLISIEDNPDFYKSIQNSEEKISYNHDVKTINNGKSEFWVSCNYRRCGNRIQGFMIDITDHKILELEHGRHNSFLEKLIENIPIGITVKNGKNGVYEIWNKEFERISGVSRSSAIGLTDQEIFPKDQADRYNITDSVVKDSVQPYSPGIVEFKSLTNELIKLEHNKIPILFNNKVDAILCVNRDVTQQFEKEKKLEEAVKAQKSAETLKSEFLANVSHELRTPLNAVYGFAQLLNDDKSISVQDRDDKIRMIYEGAKRLKRQMDNVITASKIEGDNIAIVKNMFSLTDLFNNIAESTLAEHDSKLKNIEFKVNIPRDTNIFFDSDENNLTQVLQSLISNAVKFTHEGSIEIGFQVTSLNQILFYIIDTGIGIEKEQKAVIFDMFKQANGSYTRQYGGIGVGLTISSNIVARLGGKIVVDSDFGKGTSFMFQIPGQVKVVELSEIDQAKSTRYKITSMDEANKLWKGKTILIVDDTVHIIKFFKAIFRGIDVNLEFANNGLEAVNKSKEQNFDLILMDIQMPVMNGFQATEKIRGFNTKVPIIAQTAFSSDNERSKLYEAGCDDFITKPIEKKELIGLLSRYMY